MAVESFVGSFLIAHMEKSKVESVFSICSCKMHG